MSESDVWRRQILTTKFDPRAVRVIPGFLNFDFIFDVVADPVLAAQFWAADKSAHEYTATLYSREITLHETMFMDFAIFVRGEIKISVANEDFENVLWEGRQTTNDWERHCLNIVKAAIGMPQGAVRLKIRCRTNSTALVAAVTNITIGEGGCTSHLIGKCEI